MKRFLIIALTLCFVGVTVAEAQTMMVPRYRRKKVEKDYILDKQDERLTISLGGTANFSFGMNNHINYKDYGQVINYDEKSRLFGGSVLLGVAYKLTPNFTAGLEGGILFQGNGNAIPLYGSFKYYFGEQVRRKPLRWFTYLNLGPQFYTEDDLRAVGATAGLGGGMRLCVAESLRCDLYIGYLGNMCRPKPNQVGAHDVPAGRIEYKQYNHSAVIGLNIYLW